MAHLSLRLLGAYEATLDGVPLSGFKTGKARLLLAYLAVEGGRPHRRQSLADLLWPRSHKSAGRTSLRQALSNLRQVLQDEGAQTPSLRVEGEAIQLDPFSDYEVDTVCFERCMQTSDKPHTLDSLQSALCLYRGSFLEGFSIKGSPAFNEWVLRRRENLQRQAALALAELAEACEQGGDIEGAYAYACRQVELEPLNEDAQRRGMQLLTRLGRRNEALAQYSRFKRTLADELKILPEAATTALFQKIQANRISEVSPPAGGYYLEGFYSPQAELIEIHDAQAIQSLVEAARSLQPEYELTQITFTIKKAMRTHKSPTKRPVQKQRRRTQA